MPRTWSSHAERMPTRRSVWLGAVLVTAGLLWGGPGRVGSAPDDAAVARVAGVAVTAGDLSRFWFERYREGWMRTLDHLLDERIVEHEVARLGVTLPPGTVAKAIEAEVDARRAQLAETYGDEVRLEDEVLRGYGLDLPTWQREVLGPRLRTQLLLVRIVRLDGRRRARREVRVIVVDDEARARQVLGKLRQGADFSLLAVQESRDPTGRTGGELPPIARGDLAFPGVEERLFSAAVGEVVGPLPVSVEGRSTWHLYKVIRVLEAWSGDRRQLLARLEEDLAARPVERAEYERWRARTRRDFRIEVFDPDGRRVVLPAMPGR